MKKIAWAFFCFLFLAACGEKETLFKKLDAKRTGVAFDNRITEYDSLNILNTEFIYNGGGVGIGDLNGDGLQDLFFTGSQVDNRLYLNRRGLRFEDITQKAGASKGNPLVWSAGVSIVDINHDGKSDIYVCNTMHRDPALRRNQLLVNQGNDASGIPHFVEMATAYGIADTTHSSNAQFFDYDNDGDSDLFISVNFMDRYNPNAYTKKVTDGTAVNRDRLYRNDWDAALGHPVFSDVSAQAGIIWEGYSHSALVSDFNEDGWLDVYVANDYVSNDLIYINNGDGTFTNRIAEMFKHQSASAMGSDVADVNNDGRLDYFTTEMLPYYNKRKKVFLSPNNYNTYINNEDYGYEYQYARNTFQVNRGIDSQTSLPRFSDVSFLTGTQETEWSWTPLLADFDNDGWRDLFVTNGFPRDVTDHDFGNYLSSYKFLVPPLELQNMIPTVKVPKFVFRNEGDLRFRDCSKEWGVDVSAFSNGAACGDLDNDGDLDLVVNNINDPAFIFKNTANDGAKKNNFLRLKIEGLQPSAEAFGAQATVYFDGKKQAARALSNRGYLSSSENVLHFGLGQAPKIDSVVVVWAGHVSATFTEVPVNQTFTARREAARAPIARSSRPVLFDALDLGALGLDYVPVERDYIDFNIQYTAPHKFSQYGPGLAVGDANGDGLDDLYLGGTWREEGAWLHQSPAGRFVRQTATYKLDPSKEEEDLGSLLFDADGDGDNDLYLVRGSGQHRAGDTLYQDVLCVNDGRGNFKISTAALPREAACGQAVKAADFDGDGDLDLFVGGRVQPRAFPQSDRSFLLRNDSKSKDAPIFTDVTEQFCPELAQIGLISDALWTDFNNDRQPDLLLAGEWMPLTFLQNEGNGKLKNVTASTQIADKLGWWNSLAGGDFDNDGDTDYMAGNFGQNLYFQCNSAEPLTLYAKDFDNNGWYDPFISCFWRDSLDARREFFYHTRDDMVRQLILIRKKFYNYAALGEATVQDVFSAEELKGAQILKTNWLSSSYVENLGGGKFKISPLPWQAQVAPTFGILPYDLDDDGLLDLLMVGNDYGMELLQGRADASNGVVLRNLGGGQFAAIELEDSRFSVPFDARALAQIGLADGRNLVVATQNRAPMRVFAPRRAAKFLPLKPNETHALLTLQNGQQQRREFYWGGTFLSQSSRRLELSSSVREIALFDGKNNLTRKETN
jgi:hypothetical protein